MADASSLRALALKTLKRHKVSPPRSENFQKTDPDNVALTYGESQQSSEMVAQWVDSMDIDKKEQGELEEGEISEEEGDEDQAGPSNTTPTQKSPISKDSAKSDSDAMILDTDPPQNNMIQKHRHPDVGVKINGKDKPVIHQETEDVPRPPPAESAPSHDVSLPFSNGSTITPPNEPPVASSSSVPSPSAASIKHLRAKLNMSEQEIYEAKVVILDLLGWGVPTQHILDCGVSALALAVCLTELKLRIPSNLSELLENAEREVQMEAMKEIPPSSPIAKLSIQTTPPPQAEPQAEDTIMSGTPLTESPVEVPTALPLRPSFLPPKPPAVVASKPPPPNVPTPPTPAPIAKSAAPAPLDLDDIEQQRKQELLARRAVVQSLKGKLAMPSPTVAPSFVATPLLVSPPSVSPPISRGIPQPPSNDLQIDMFIADAIKRGEAGPQHSLSPPNVEKGLDDVVELEQMLDGQIFSPNLMGNGFGGGDMAMMAYMASNDFGIHNPMMDLHQSGMAYNYNPAFQNGFYPHNGNGNGLGRMTPGFNSFMLQRSNSDFAFPPPTPSFPLTPNASFSSIPPSPSGQPGQPRSNTINNALTKRVAKRPVAADFVEYSGTPTDTSPTPVAAQPITRPPSASFARAGPISFHTSPADASLAPPLHKRRKTFGPFVSTRLVIDVSDAESSDGSDAEGDVIDTKRVSQTPSLASTVADESDRERERARQEKQAEWERKQQQILQIKEQIRIKEEERRLRMMAGMKATPPPIEATVQAVPAPVPIPPAEAPPLSPLQPKPSTAPSASVTVTAKEDSTISIKQEEPSEVEVTNLTTEAPFLGSTTGLGDAPNDQLATNPPPPSTTTPNYAQLDAISSGSLSKSVTPLPITVPEIISASDGAPRSPTPMLSYPEPSQQDASLLRNADASLMQVDKGSSITQSIPQIPLLQDEQQSTSSLPGSSQTKPVFRPYRSPLPTLTVSSSLPLPLEPFLPAFCRSPSPSSLSSSYYAQIQQLDLGPLQRAHASLIDPQRQLCRYEIPGGGTCRDGACQDVHMHDLDPSDEETARYISQSIRGLNEGRFLEALRAARTQMASPATMTDDPQTHISPLSQRVILATTVLLNNHDSMVASA